ncbi:MAG: phenylacetate--CoA ligase family protein, partial [Candidatus Woesearchaeota archaeon]
MELYNSIEGGLRGEINSIKLKRLKEIVKKAYEIPYYHDKMLKKEVDPSEINSLEDLKKLPFTTKEDLRKCYPDKHFAVDNKEIVRLHASSGTTGKSTFVAYTKKDIELWSEVMARNLVSCGVTKDDIIQVSYGYGLFTGGLGLHYGAEKLGATVIPASSGSTKRQIELIDDLNVTVIACTPSYALYLYDFIEKNDLNPDLSSLRIGLFGAESWSN